VGDSDGDDIDAAVIDALLAQIDALASAMARTTSVKARAVLAERKEPLHKELELMRAKVASKTDSMPNPFQPKSSSAPDTVEVKREPSTQKSSEDSERLAVFVRSSESGALGADTMIKAGPGLFELNGAPPEVAQIALVLCAAVEPVRVRDLRDSTELTLERLLGSLRRLVLLKLVELA
jgi:hypothetical protein